eukprot:CAMPEP_0168179684 /NCGR_PEP_ID=MMETSP0139_2-20121125/10004_1 /TAXON_ID=44445 /ORGANISM="Pseudo-nitzschia australis, Strain 10249 10 AB" /LENGTH=456 /DNA_ID=CAMNT_0008099589 /DNA_START=128 /DNA_END=1498 /DNA_ORIENTATION=-
MPSFYQRKLPETCVAFASRKGKKMFKNALENNGLKSFYNLIEQHHTQTEPAFCGISTLVMVLNALAVDPGQQWKGPWRWYTENMLNCCVDLEEIKKDGITLRDFHCLAYCQGLSVEEQYCDETSSLENFRRVVERACIEQTAEEENEPESNGEDDNHLLECLVVSYSRKVLGQTGDGHFSPLAAYDKESDSVLILDTARFKYGAHWAKLPMIYEAMKPFDKASSKPRGYALLSFVPENKTDDVAVDTISVTSNENKSTALINTSQLSTQPASILFRSKMNQKRQRQLYKNYIKSLRDEKYKQEAIPYDAVRSFWCKDTHGAISVWEIIVPTRVHNEEEKDLLSQIRTLLMGLKDATINGNILDDHNDDHNNNHREEGCNPYSFSESGRIRSTNHTAYVTAEETLYLIYLATLSEEQRNYLVMNFKSAASDVTRKQIIKEAAMIASAIEVSDQLTSL